MLLLTLTYNVYGQNDSVPIKSSVNYESLTLRLYFESKWDSLIKTGEVAISEGHDYFYMLVRTGAAAFYTGNYSKAAGFFEKARKQNRYDDYTNELLYLSYLYSGRTPQAFLLRKEMSAGLRSEISKNRGCILYTEAGIIQTDGQKNANKPMLNDTVNFSDKYWEDNALFMVAGWRQPVANRFWITAAISILDFNKHRQVEISEWDTLSGSYKVRQKEYYLSPNITLNKRLTFSPSFRYTDTEVTEPIRSTDTITNLYLGTPVAKNFNDYSAGAEIMYSSHYWKVSTGVWNIRAGDIKLWQSSSSFIFLPYGNLNLYTVSTYTRKTEDKKSPDVFTQTIGCKILNKTWLELVGTLGNVAGTSEYNGQLLNNQINRSKYRLSSLLIIDLTNKLRVSFRYQYMKSESPAWFLDDEYRLLERSYKYNRHLITGGISWNV